jgi:hypothetical protein
MDDRVARGGRAGFGAGVLLASVALNACGTNIPSAAPGPVTPSPPVASPTAASSPVPSSPAAFEIKQVPGSFPAVTALTSTGGALYWASDAAIWRYTPGDGRAARIYENQARRALVWDIAAHGDAVVFSEQLGNPAGSWRVSFLAGDAALPVEVDSGVAERGAPPTVDVDERRIAWTGFDEGSGSPRSFLRVAERARPAIARTLLDVDIDDRLLWYPQLERDTLWYGSIDPDFRGTGGHDTISIETIDLASPSAEPVQLDEAGNPFEPVPTPEYLAWKSIAPGFSALTWGDIHVRDRRSAEGFVIATRANHPSVGARFVTYEEFFHEKLLVYDLDARRTIEVSDPFDGAKGTLGVPTIAGALLAYSVSTRGDKTVYWIRLPD